MTAEEIDGLTALVEVEAYHARFNSAHGEQGDGGSGTYHKITKRVHRRRERKRARRNPECIPGYNRYRGYES